MPLMDCSMCGSTPAIRVGGRSEARALSQGRPPADLAAAGLSRPDGRGWRESRHADRRRDLEGCTGYPSAGEYRLFRSRRLALHPGDRQSVVLGKRVSARVDLGGRRVITKNKKET